MAETLSQSQPTIHPPPQLVLGIRQPIALAMGPNSPTLQREQPTSATPSGGSDAHVAQLHITQRFFARCFMCVS